jgi:hypothetical protein
LQNQLSNIADTIQNALSPSQLYSLEQQALQLAQNVFNGNVDVNTAVNQLLLQLQQYLGANSQILTNAKPLAQQLINAVLSFFPNSPAKLEKSGAAVPRTDFLALANELQLNNLDAVLATFPQFAVISN